MKILISGASGYIGAALYASLTSQFSKTVPAASKSQAPFRVFGTYHQHQIFPELLEMKLEDIGSVESVIKGTNPEIIIHAAAVPSQSIFNTNLSYAETVNRKGTANIVRAANQVGAKVIFISSEASLEDTDYGQSKRFGESFVRENCQNDWVILQPGTTYGLSPNTTHPRPFNRLLAAARARQPIAFDNSEHFRMSWLENLCQVLQEVIQRPISKEIIPVILSRSTTRYEVASFLLRSLPIKVELLEAPKKEAVALTQDSLKQLTLPYYSIEEALAKIEAEFLSALQGDSA